MEIFQPLNAYIEKLDFSMETLKDVGNIIQYRVLSLSCCVFLFF